MNEVHNKDNIIFFFFCEEDIERALKKFTLKKIRDSVCILSSDEAYLALQKKQISFQYVEDYFSKKDATKLFELAVSWSIKWHKASKTELHFMGINVLELIDLSMSNFFAKKLFYFSSIENLFAKEQPSLIFLGQESKGLKNSFLGGFENISPIISLCAKSERIVLMKTRNVFLHSLDDSITVRLIMYLMIFPKMVIRRRQAPRSQVLMLGHHYHLLNIGLLLEKLKIDGIKALVVGKIGVAHKYLISKGIRNLELDQSLTLGDLPKYLRIKFRMLFASMFINKQKLELMFQLNGQNLYSIFENKIHFEILVDSMKCVSTIIRANQIVTIAKPNVLVCVSVDSAINAFINIGKLQGIKSLEIQHGFTVGSDSRYIDSDKLISWGKIPNDIYTRTGAQKRKLLIGGWPVFEKYKVKKLKIRNTIASSKTVSFLGQDPEGASLLFMTRTPIENLTMFLKAVSKFKYKKIYVRLHPRASKNIAIQLAKKYHVKFEFGDNMELSRLLEISDVFVVQTTTATLEALTTDKPVIYLSSMRWPSKFIENTGVASEVSDYEQLVHALKMSDRLITNKVIVRRKSFLDEYVNFSADSVYQLQRIINSYSK